MHVFQTIGEPPKSGRIILAIMGCTQKSSPALMNMVSANKNGKTRRFIVVG